MYYSIDREDHGLPHNPFKAIVAPRPIGWISTIDAQGRANLAPYSFFNAFSDRPPIVAFSADASKAGMDEPKDSPSIIRETGEFCVNIVSYELRDKMNISSGAYPRGKDEFELAGLTKGKSNIVAAPYVAESPAALECKLFQMVDLPGDYTLVIGLVVGVHIDDRHIKDGLLDVTSYQPMARLGYRDYSAVKDVFPLNRPGQR
jgi:flavin reductase (DIM6/NTAB) family NADH-FMN oxidoreductase RutF